MNKLSIFICNFFKKLIITRGRVVNINSDKKGNPLVFVDLAPVDCADEDETYTSALKFSVESKNIQNIALTGPYGSGKTSVIRTFEKKTNYKFLNISLAAFESPRLEGGKSANMDEAQNQAIERSILQQMIYGVPPKKLPYSRFKRISPPSFLKIKSVVFVIVVFMGINEYLNGNVIEFISNKEYSNPWLYISVTFLSIVLCFLFFSLYKATRSYSIRKLSIQSGEIELDDSSSDSILNRHLDEIIYFFEETNYDVVVIEDLDRFGSTEIFIKLREINKLINDQKRSGGKKFKPIKFLYAIKDDMFINKDRAKFFDFIIPVIPIINSSNSYEKITARLSQYGFYKKIDSQFLKEISLYIDDLRLIHNVVNEFIIYEKKLISDSLNNAKLLAMIIYKNVYPNDFEALHHSCGEFFGILKSKRDLINSRIVEIDNEIFNLKEKIKISKNENLEGAEELIKIFIFHACNGFQADGFYVNNDIINFNDIFKWENFSKLFDVSNVCINAYHHYNGWHRVFLGKSFYDLEKEALKGTTFIKRKENIDNKSKNNIAEINSKMVNLKYERLNLYKAPIHEIIKKFNVDIALIANKNNIKDASLLVFLVKNGYLDETYYSYISNFHEGRISRNDRDYLLSIRDFKAPNPLLKIDTPNEVCDDMREDDFEHEYSLNVNLVDYLLSTKNHKHQKISSVIGFMSRYFEKSKEFFDAYWAEGKNLESLIKAMAKQWPLYAYEVISEGHPVEHMASILAYVDADYLSKKMNDENMLSEYISENIEEIFSCGLVVIDNFDFLKYLDVKVKNIDGVKNQDKLLDFIHKNNCYQINFDNVSIILNKYKNSYGEAVFDEECASYSTIREYGSQELNQYIAENLSQYADEIIIAREDNSREAKKYIFDLINSDKLSPDQKKSIINIQEFVFPGFNGVPGFLWEGILLSEKLVFNWKNVFDFFNSKDCSNDLITEILNRGNVVEALSSEKIKGDSLGCEGALNISRFILKNDAIANDNYCKLCSCFDYVFNNFPEKLSREKLLFLTNKRIVRLNNDSFSFSCEDRNLLALLISRNIDEYIKGEGSYPIDDAVREVLIFSDISDAHKKHFAKSVSFEAVKKSNKLMAYISSLVFESNSSPSDFSSEIICHCVAYTKPISKAITVLSKSISFLARDKVMSVLRSLPEPYSDIASNGKRPKLDKAEENIELAKQLKAAEIVASVSEEDDYVRINTFKGAREE